ncbi:MAG: MFS transporter [Bacillota bacterium]
MFKSIPRFFSGVLGLAFLGRITAIAARLHIIPFFPEFMERFDLTYAQMGLLYSAFFLAYGICLVPMGIAADRFSPRLLFAAGWGVAGLGIASFAWAPSFGWLLAARILAGVGVASLYPATFKLIATHISSEKRGKAMGLLEVGAGMGMLLTVTAAPALIAWLPLPVIFLATGGLALPAIVALLALPEAPAPPRTAPAAAPQAAPGIARGSELLRQPRFWFYLLQTLLVMATINGLIGWFPTYLQQLGIEKVGVGLAMGLINVGQMGAAWPAGGISDRIGRRTPVIHTGSALLILLPLALLFGASGATLLMVLATLYGMGIGISGVPTGTLGTELFGRRWAGTVSSAAAACSMIASSATGTLFGWIVDAGGFTPIWILISAMLLLRILLTALIGEGVQPAPAPAPGRLQPALISKEGLR